jgi:hypothetical protein
MRIPLFISGFLVPFMATAATGPEWVFREFINQWNAPENSMEGFLNNECRPAALDGIQVFAVQKGHGGTFNLHVYCRADHAADAAYRVSMPTVEMGKIDTLVQGLVSNPHLRVGPFHFGDDGQRDGILLIEKL